MRPAFWLAEQLSPPSCRVKQNNQRLSGGLSSGVEWGQVPTSLLSKTSP